MEKIGKTTGIFVVLLTCLWCIALVMPVFAAEKWESNMRKDFAKVLREKNKPAVKHRDFIGKWQKEGRLSALLSLYEAEKENREPSSARIAAAFYYGLGYTHALHATETGETFDSAITYLQHALKISPDLFWAHFNLGGIYQQQDENTEALAEFEICIRLNPNYYPVYYRMGEIHLKQQNYAEALHAFETTRTLNRKWEYPQYGIGLVYLAQGEIDQARETFENLTQRRKKFAPAYFKLGQVLATEGFFDDALEEYAKGAQHEPYSVEVIYELAIIFNQKGHTEGAIKLYQRILEIGPESCRSTSGDCGGSLRQGWHGSSTTTLPKGIGFDAPS